jgi:hypothetical protein
MYKVLLAWSDMAIKDTGSEYKDTVPYRTGSIRLLVLLQNLKNMCKVQQPAAQPARGSQVKVHVQRVSSCRTTLLRAPQQEKLLPPFRGVLAAAMRAQSERLATCDAA